MDRPDAFSIALWFKRNSEVLGIPTNHQIDNLIIAQSSAYDNDNLEIGSEGAKLRFILILAVVSRMPLTRPRGAGISDGVWHHLVVSYGNGLKV